MRQNLGTGLCLTQCRAIGRPRLGGGSGRLGRGGHGWGGHGWGTGLGYGIGIGVRDREYGVRDREYGVVQGVWLRAGLGVSRDWGTGGLWYGWLGVWGGARGLELGWGTGGLAYGMGVGCVRVFWEWLGFGYGRFGVRYVWWGRPEMG